MSQPLIDVAELQQRGEDVTILDVRYRLGGPPGAEEFAAGHIPGAVFVDLDRELAALPGVGGRHPLPSTADFEAAARRWGVRADRPVVIYDDWGSRASARAWWLLRFHSHQDVRVLDGGWSAWLGAGAPTATGHPTPPDRGDFQATPGAMPVVEADEVPGVDVLVDARAPERFAGVVEPVDPVAGHIPGAVNVPTDLNLDDSGRFREATQLASVYARVGATAGADIAAYCGSGVTAAHDILAMEIAGIRAALYPGSWSGWIADAQRPVERP